MAISTILIATFQSAAIAAVSNIIAQVITSVREDAPLIIDWVPVFQFWLFTLIQTPPNFLWQQLLEEMFPAYHIAPTRAAVASAAAGNEKELDKEAKQGRLVEPQLNVGNTLIKTLLDQTLGAFVNTWLFSLCMNSIRASMAHRPPYAHQSLEFLASGNAFDYGNVDFNLVVAHARADFWTIVRAGWMFWPFVSLFNFAFVKSVEMRNLLGSLAGVAWGVYMSLFTAGH